MNQTVLMGRTTSEIELRETQSGKQVTNFSLAVQRRFKNKDTGDYDADFIRCVAWEKSAIFLSRYVQKGQKIGIVGSLRTHKWADDSGNNRYETELLVDSVYFAESKKNGVPPDEKAHDWSTELENTEGELPF